VLAVFLGEVTPALKETVARSAEIISGAGARLGVEFSPLGPVATIPDALEIVDAAGPDRAGVVVDSWHLLHGPNPWEELTQLPLDRIAYVQFTDGFGEISMEETMSRRALPGEGELELERFVGTLRERGWEGVVSVEVLNRDLREMPVGESAARAYLATTSYWR
jgi:sugar phosphate isomerase/epimerase